jgi:two-component sensor histidine kinase
VPTGTFVIAADPTGVITWAVNVPGSWASGPCDGLALNDVLPTDVAEPIALAIADAVATGQPGWLEVATSLDGVTKWYALWLTLDRDDRGASDILVMTGLDITEQKHRERTLRTLLREVSHRSKNLLAIIQSIATQTGRHTETVDAFLARFRGRIQSMASTQDLVTASNWRGAELHELARSQVARYVADPALSLYLTGERPYLNPNAALHIGLALHELAVNSVSYGALSRPEGAVAVDCAWSDDEPSELCLRWTEAISIADGEVGRKRFGSTALERVVPAALGSTADLAIEPELLTYRLRIPRDNFEIG